jgi:S1-C subfamily serine protease
MQMTLVPRIPFRMLALLVAAAIAAAVAVAGASGSASSASLDTGVVDIETRLGFTNGAAAGTGMVLTPSGQVLTNNHVIRGATTIRVRVPDTGRTYRARVLGYSISGDVALLQLQGASGLQTVSVGDSSKVKIGQNVTAVGNVGGTGTLVTTTGTVTGLGRTITVSDDQGGTARLTQLIRTSAELRPGDSGGPLLGGAHRVIGMNVAASAELAFRSSNGGYAIPVNRASSVARQITAGRSSSTVHVGGTPFLGVTVHASYPSPSSASTGVLVTGVKPGSPAARAGLVTGDVIRSVDGHAVRTPAGLVAQLLHRHPGDKVLIAWINQSGNRKAANVTLASGPPQ